MERWDPRRPLPAAPDDLTRQLLLHADWLRLVREDPLLPAAHLTRDWPAIRADKVFHRLDQRLAPSARAVARDVVDTIEVAPRAEPAAHRPREIAVAAARSAATVPATRLGW